MSSSLVLGICTYINLFYELILVIFKKNPVENTVDIVPNYSILISSCEFIGDGGFRVLSTLTYVIVLASCMHPVCKYKMLLFI